MATAARHHHPWHEFAQRHFTDTNVLIYCLLLFFFCLALAVITSSDNLSDDMYQPEFKSPSDRSPVVPIPADQGSTDSYKLSA